MAAINPPTITDTLRLALVPGQETEFSQRCTLQEAAIAQAMGVEGADIPQLQQQRAVWISLSQASALLPLFRIPFFITGAATTTSAALLLCDKIKLVSGSITLAGCYGTGVAGSKLVKLAHQLLDRAQRLTTHPEEAQNILNEFTITIALEDGTFRTIINTDRV
jgi:hypothetical protein